MTLLEILTGGYTRCLPEGYGRCSGDLAPISQIALLVMLEGVDFEIVLGQLKCYD